MLPDCSQVTFCRCDAGELGWKMCALCGECCLTAVRQHSPHSAHICHPTLQHHNSYKRTDNYRQWNTVGSPEDGHKDARNMLRYYWLPLNHYLLQGYNHYLFLPFCFTPFCFNAHCHFPPFFNLPSPIFLLRPLD